MRAENFEIQTKSLTDELPVCHTTGTGTATNQSYKEDGTRQEVHKSYDHSFQCQQIDDSTCLYLICSGQNGSKVADFAKQKLTAEILFGQLTGCTPEGVKDVLRQAFISVERDYLNSIDEFLAQKAELQCEIPDGMREYEITYKYERNLSRINQINNELTVGTSIVLALIYKSKLYICNIGNCRALLCKTDDSDVLRAIQLSVDHNIENEDEALRLSQIGLDVSSFKQSPFSSSTRCIGCYSGKAGYKDSADLSTATSEPIISLPEIVGPIPLDDSCRFLVLMSGGLCRTLQEIYASQPHIMNRELVQSIVQQFRTQSTLAGVAQSVIHQVVQQHHDTYMTLSEESPFKSRSDATLMVRNFNFPMPNAIQSQRNRNNVTFNPIIARQLSDVNTFYSSSDPSSIIDTTSYTNSSTTTSTSDQCDLFDKNVRIRPYVDFSDYYENVETARKNGTLSTTIQYD